MVTFQSSALGGVLQGGSQRSLRGKDRQLKSLRRGSPRMLPNLKEEKKRGKDRDRTSTGDVYQ